MPSISMNTLKATWRAFNEDKATRLAASIAYSAIFSMVPLFILCIAVAGFFLGLGRGGHGHRLAENAMLGTIAQYAGSQSAEALRGLIAATFNRPRTSTFAHAAAWVTFLVGASGFFAALQDALNSIWNINQIKDGWGRMVRDRAVSLSMLLLVSVLLLLSLGAAASLTLLKNILPAHSFFLGNAWLIALVTRLFMLVLMTIAFCMLFKVLPDVNIAWRDVVFGSFVTALLFVGGEIVLAKYLIIAGVASGYGAAGSLLVLLIWIYYSAMIFLLGAEFTKVLARGPTTVAPSTLVSYQEKQAGVDPRSIRSSS